MKFTIKIVTHELKYLLSIQRSSHQDKTFFRLAAFNVALASYPNQKDDHVSGYFTAWIFTEMSALVLV